MRKLFAALAVLCSVSSALAGDSTHPFKTSKGKMVDVPWWETMASCYGRFEALSNYAQGSSADAAGKLKNYGAIAFNLALTRLTKERGIPVEEAQKIVIPHATQAAQITTQGFAIYKMTGTVDQKNNELIDECFADFNGYNKQFPGELK